MTVSGTDPSRSNTCKCEDPTLPSTWDCMLLRTAATWKQMQHTIWGMVIIPKLWIFRTILFDHLLNWYQLILYTYSLESLCYSRYICIPMALTRLIWIMLYNNLSYSTFFSLPSEYYQKMWAISEHENCWAVMLPMHEVAKTIKRILIYQLLFKANCQLHYGSFLPHKEWNVWYCAVKTG